MMKHNTSAHSSALLFHKGAFSKVAGPCPHFHLSLLGCSNSPIERFISVSWCVNSLITNVNIFFSSWKLSRWYFHSRMSFSKSGFITITFYAGLTCLSLSTQYLIHFQPNTNTTCRELNQSQWSAAKLNNMILAEQLDRLPWPRNHLSIYISSGWCHEGVCKNIYMTENNIMVKWRSFELTHQRL